MNNPITSLAGLTMLFFIFAADFAFGGGSEPLVEPYNHILNRSTLNVGHGDEIQVREILFAPGWKAPRHYHNSDLFLYVISGDFEVEMEGEGLKTYTTGQALRMKPNVPMDARNLSDTKPLKFAVFQVGNPDAPFVVPVEHEE